MRLLKCLARLRPGSTRHASGDGIGEHEGVVQGQHGRSSGEGEEGLRTAAVRAARDGQGRTSVLLHVHHQTVKCRSDPRRQFGFQVGVGVLMGQVREIGAPRPDLAGHANGL